jgi:hypothetical protein
MNLAMLLLLSTITVERKFIQPALDDAAAKATITVVGGDLDGNSAPLAALTDGLLPTSEDQPSANVFFRANSWGGRMRIDLGRVMDVSAVRTFSWHPGSRAPQLYKVYVSDGSAADLAPSTKLDPESAGWTQLAFVDTRPAEGEEGGQYVVTISDPGRFRYLLFDVFETESEDAWGNTFYSEIDVLAK